MSEELMDLFLSETQEHLQDLNAALLELEKRPNDGKLVNEMFRICHNLKSEASSMDFNDVASLAHQMENVLDLCRQSQLTINSKIADVFFECMDAISRTMQNAPEYSNMNQGDLNNLLGRLKTFIMN